MLSFIQCSGCNSRITYIVVFQNRCSMFGNLKGLFRSQSYAGISLRPFSEKPVIKNISWLSEGWNGMLESVEEDLLWNRAVARGGWPVRNTGWSTSSQHKVMIPLWSTEPIQHEIKSGNISLYYSSQISDLKCGLIYPVYMHILKYLCFDCINIEFPVNSACIHFQPKKFGKGVF